MSDLIKKIKDNKDLKNLSILQLKQLCEELRNFLITSVSRTGGHLASNLGVVELTTAIHYVFDPMSDRVIWDVGHQSYVHKILTGRINEFDNLRTFGGMSGFPKRNESAADAFNTGHSSTSISAALGIARARDLNNDNYNVIAVFGDGALTGGMMYEAMNDAGRTKTKLILILNDNEMSISENVGAVSSHLRQLRLKGGYYKSKQLVHRMFDRVPIVGEKLTKATQKIKKAVKYSVMPDTIFDDFGFEYIGPVNGHDLPKLIHSLEEAKKKTAPVVIHVNTIKGKGYTPAQEHPEMYHGVGVFEPSEGICDSLKKDYSYTMGHKLCEIARSNDKVTAITCAMCDGTGLAEFSNTYKNRFFDVGIAEQHAATLAAGMAVGGYTSVLAVYSSFLQRAYDQILHDVCLQKLHVVFCVDRAGIVGADGETHQGIYDVSYLSHMPYMMILSPCCYSELCDMLEYAVNNYDGPVAIRYPRGNTEFITTHEFTPCKGYIIEEGDDLTVISTGRMMKTAAEVCERIKKFKISAQLVEMPTITPFDEKTVIRSAEKTKYIVTIEDNVFTGGIADRTASVIAKKGLNCKFRSFCLPDIPIQHGSVDEIDKYYGIDTGSIVENITRDWKE